MLNMHQANLAQQGLQEPSGSLSGADEGSMRPIPATDGSFLHRELNTMPQALPSSWTIPLDRQGALLQAAA